MARTTNRRRIWLGELVEGLVRQRCATCGAGGCVTWGHQYQPLVCQVEAPPTTGRPELRAIDQNSRSALFRGWYRVK
jgi:hypothetical protein